MSQQKFDQCYKRKKQIKRILNMKVLPNFISSLKPFKSYSGIVRFALNPGMVTIKKGLKFNSSLSLI